MLNLLARAHLILMFVCIGFASARADPENRVALVIGNNLYQAVSQLSNPVSDATMVADTLRQAGFKSVDLAINLTRERFIETLRMFADRAAQADWAVIYYAGHGIEMSGANYLVPVDARLKIDRDVQFEAIPTAQALTAIEGAKKLRLVILDACRDNPFAATMSRTVGSTRSIGVGLAKMEPEAGTLVAYAAKHGQVAHDGVDGHSPFVKALVKHMLTPGLEINRLFRKITSDVQSATDRQQEPFTYGSLPDADFYFKNPLTANTGQLGSPLGSDPAASNLSERLTVPEASISPAPSGSKASIPSLPLTASPGASQPQRERPLSVLSSASADPSIDVRVMVPPGDERTSQAAKSTIGSKTRPLQPKPLAPKVAIHTQNAPLKSNNPKNCFMFNGTRVCE